MRSAEALAAELGRRADGVVCGRDLRAAGVTQRAISHLVAVGILVRFGRDVFGLRDHPDTWRQHLRACLALAGDGAVVGARSAARLHGFYAYRDDPAVEVIRRRGGDHRISIGRLIEARDLLPKHEVIVDGLPVTTVARTFFDLCGDPDPELRSPVGKLVHERRMAQVANDGLARRGLTFVQEATVLAAVGRRGRNGTRLVRDLLTRFGPRYTPTFSDSETLLAELLEVHGIEAPERQAPVSGPSGFIGIVDFLWVRPRVIVEVDSRWHDGPLDAEVDAARDAALEAIGYTVLRVRYGEMVTDPGAFIRRLKAQLAADIDAHASSAAAS